MVQKKRQYPEFQVQVEFVSLMRLYYSDALMFAVPNGGARSGPRDGRRFKMMGVLSGVSDIVILEPNAVYSGFFIEFKAPGRSSGLSSTQREFAEKVQARGFKFAEHCSAVDALRDVEEYLGWRQKGQRVSEKLRLA